MKIESLQAYSVEEVIEYCEICNGTGLKYADRDEVLDAITFAEMTMQQKKEIVRQWRKTEEIPCYYCEGKGQWIERY